MAASGRCRSRTGMTWSGTGAPRVRWTRAGSGSATRQERAVSASIASGSRRASCRRRRTRTARPRSCTSCSRARGSHGRTSRCTRLRPRDCVIHRANEQEHTFIGGPEGLEYIVFGTRHPTEIGWLPRSRAIRIGWPWVEGRDDDPWDTDAEAAELEHGEPSPRPDNILNVDEVELEDNGTMTTAPLATRERSEQAGLHWEQVAPGKHGSVPHCHSEEEEVFVILEGEGTLELWPSPVREARGVPREDIPIRAGHVIARPPGTGRLARLPRRRDRADDAHLRHATTRRHGLVPALAEDHVARPRRDRSHRVARLRRRRAARVVGHGRGEVARSVGA